MTKRTLATIITKHHLWRGASADSLVKICSKQELQDMYDNFYWENGREKTMSEILKKKNNMNNKNINAQSRLTIWKFW